MQDEKLYDSLKKKVDEFVSNNTFISSFIADEDDIKKILKSLLDNKYDKKSVITNFKIYYLYNDVKVIYYNSKNHENLKEKENIIIVKGEIPIIRFNCCRQEKGDSVYTDESFYLFEKKYLQDIFKISTVESGNLKKERANIYFNVCNDMKYFSKKYEVLYLDGKVISIEKNSNNHLIDSDFDSRFNLFSSEKKKAINNIVNAVDFAFGIDEVKEYTIKKRMVNLSPKNS